METDERASGERGLREYLVVVRRRWVTIALVTALVALVSFALSSRSSEVWSAYSEVLLTGGQGLDDVAVDEVQVGTEMRVLESRSIAEEVAKKLGPGGGDIGEVQVSNAETTRVLRITVPADDPRLAARAADAYAEVYVARRRARVGDSLATMQQQLQPRIDAATAQLVDIDRQIQAELARAPVPGGEGGQLGVLQTRRSEVAGELTALRQQLSEVQINAALRQGGAEVLTRAEVPDQPSSPRPRRDLLVGALLGLLAGVGLAFVRESLRDTLVDPDEVAQVVAPLPVLGAIPYSSEVRAPSSMSVSSPVTEAFRSLRTSVQFLAVRRPLRTLMVTSPMAGEGKSTVTANLAASMAMAGRRTVLVCCDLRQPVTHDLFGLSNRQGLSDVLSGEATVHEVLHDVELASTGSPLRVLTSGPLPPNPSELLGLPALGKTLAELTEMADVVVLDSPPLLPVTDSVVLAGSVDGVLLLARPGVTTRRGLLGAVTRCERAGAQVLGVVLTATHRGEGEYGREHFLSRWRRFLPSRSRAWPTSAQPERRAGRPLDRRRRDSDQGAEAPAGVSSSGSGSP